MSPHALVSCYIQFRVNCGDLQLILKVENYRGEIRIFLVHPVVVTCHGICFIAGEGANSTKGNFYYRN